MEGNKSKVESGLISWMNSVWFTLVCDAKLWPLHYPPFMNACSILSMRKMPTIQRDVRIKIIVFFMWGRRGFWNLTFSSFPSARWRGPSSMFRMRILHSSSSNQLDSYNKVDIVRFEAYCHWFPSWLEGGKRMNKCPKSNYQDIQVDWSMSHWSLFLFTIVVFRFIYCSMF